VGAHPADRRSRSGRPDGVRSGSARPGPLVARPDLGTVPRSGVDDRAEPDVGATDPDTSGRGRRGRANSGRVRRFTQRYGWRAYAVPLLTVATVVTLGDLAANGSDSGTTPAAATTSEETLAAPFTGALPAPLLSAGEEEISDVPAAVDAGPSETPTLPAAETYVEKGAGTVSIVDRTSAVYGSGPLRRFVVEIEDGIGVDGAAFAEAVGGTLADPRSWGNGGRLSFQQVGAAEASTAQYEFKVTLISPGNMDRYCPGVRTGGYTSCRYGERAVINLARWATAVPHYDGDIATYRQYVVNHEVGHALGNGHQECPGPGAVAPVMQQQTLGLDGCVKNAWPYP
jgi:hypothetical protein